MFWTRYSRLLAGMFVAGTILLVWRHGAVLGVWDVVDCFMGLVSLVGLFAYVHGRRVLSPTFWAAFLPLSLFWTAVYVRSLGNPVIVHPTAKSQVPEFLLLSVFMFPLYLALFRLAYGSRPVPVRRPSRS